MLMLVGFAIAALSTVVAGGDIRRLSGLQIRLPGLLLVAFGVQLVIISVIPQGSEGVRGAIHIATYLLVFVFLVLNARIPGVWLVALGALMNFAAISANGGVMPADPEAVARAGLTQEEGTFENSRPVDDPKLSILGDRFAIPESWPASNVFSIGDVMLLLGVALTMHTVSGSRLVPRRFSAADRNV